jgi:Raf kinase inhibitor-like YbhB/YbcL family protein
MRFRFPFAGISILLLTLSGCSSSDDSAADAAPRDAQSGVDAASGTLESGAPADAHADGSAGSVDAGGGTLDDGGGDDDASPDGALDAAHDAGPFALTSSVLKDNTPVPKAFTCATLSTQNAQGTGGDASPDLAWSGAPAGTMSFAVVLHDNANKNTHWVIYDIPANVTSLPKGIARTATLTVPPGARQVKSYDGGYGYMGPCPNVLHEYTFTVYAMPTATTPGITAGDRAGAEATVKGAALGSAVMTVTSSDSQG